jgi:iron complex outermembrane recepter protein
MKIAIKSGLIGLSIIMSGFLSSYGQADSTQINIENLSLEQLLNTQVVSVSKKSENLFDAPLSASVITSEAIAKAGCTSIMEALRLAPGMIVREQSNGNYDIHLRGINDAAPNAPFDGTATTTLVMIDNRPIYNYLRGGTFWEALPVDLNDIERIEVIRGPAAALYGPNAVNGVINIITKKLITSGLYIIANAQQGTDRTIINNASAGYLYKNWSVIASANYQMRERSQTSYYEFYRDTLVEHPDYSIGLLGDTVYDFDQRYPEPDLAVEKYAGNLFMNYESSNKVKFSLNSGSQHSLAQKVATENGVSPFSRVQSNSSYADFHADIKQFTAQFSYNTGTQSLGAQHDNKYDFNTIDANIEYNFVKNNFTLKPGLSYRKAIYDDTKYSDIVNKTGMFNSRGEITTQSASLRAEYKFFKKKLRIVAGASATKFNYPDTTYASYELAATYKLNRNNLFRFVYSSSPRSSNIYDTYIDQHVAYFQSGFQKYTLIALESNKNLKLLSSDLFEVGYRVNIKPWLSVDAEIFHSRSKNFSCLIGGDTYTQQMGNDTLEIVPITPANLPLEQVQNGITFSINYISARLQVKPFITLQQTTIRNYAPFHNTSGASFLVTSTTNPEENNIYSGIGQEAPLKSTPTAFGGATINYVLTSKINININSYYYSPQTAYHASNIIFNDGVRGVDNIKSKVIVNTKISYQPLNNLLVFVTCKNLLGDTSREYFKTDTTPFMILGGVSFDLH